MKKITVSILTTLLMLSMVFSSSVFAANEETSAWDSFLGLFSAKTAETSDVGVEYRGHVQNKGDFPLDGSWIQGPNVLGTVGESLRLEAFWIKLTNEVPAGLHIQYRVHVQNKGWMAPVEDGALAGTQGEGLQIESVEIKLVDDAGNPAVGYSVEYRGHIQNKGDMPADGSWYKDGEQLGTVGEFLRLEALEVKIVQTKADMTAYNAAVAAANALTEADYTADSWAALETALATVVTEDNTQAEVDAATAAINAAIDALVLLPQVTGVSATTAKTLTVEFNQAITDEQQAAAVFAVKNGTTTVTTVPTWAEDGMSVDLTRSSNLQAGDYTVTVTGFDFKEGKNVGTTTVVAPKVSKIEFESVNAIVVTAAPTTATFKYSVFDQYGTDITKTTTLTGTANNSVTVSFNPSTKTATLTYASGFLTTGAPTSVITTLINGATGTTATQTMTIVKEIQLSEFSLGEITYPTGKDRLYQSTTEAGKIGFTALDQFGDAVSNPSASVTLVSSDPTTATFSWQKDALGNSYIRVTTSAIATGTEKAITLTAVSTTGLTSSLPMTIYKTSTPTTIVFGDVNKTEIAAGDTDVYLDVTVYDQFGVVMTPDKYITSVVNNASNGLKMTYNNVAVVGTTLVANSSDPNYGKLKLTFASSTAGSATITSNLNASAPVTKTVTVLAARVLTEAVAPASNPTMMAGGTAKLGFTFNDQFGTVMTTIPNVATGSHEIKITNVSGDAGALTLNTTGSNATASADNDQAKLNSIYVNAAAGKAGVYTVEVNVYSKVIAQRTSADIIASAITTVTVQQSGTTGMTYAVQPIGRDLFGNSTAAQIVDGSNAYAAPIVVTATDASGNVMTVPANQITNVQGAGLVVGTPSTTTSTTVPSQTNQWVIGSKDTDDFAADGITLSSGKATTTAYVSVNTGTSVQTIAVPVTLSNLAKVTSEIKIVDRDGFAATNTQKPYALLSTAVEVDSFQFADATAAVAGTPAFVYAKDNYGVWTPQATLAPNNAAFTALQPTWITAAGAASGVGFDSGLVKGLAAGTTFGYKTGVAIPYSLNFGGTVNKSFTVKIGAEVPPVVTVTTASHATGLALTYNDTAVTDRASLTLDGSVISGQTLTTDQKTALVVSNTLANGATPVNVSDITIAVHATTGVVSITMPDGSAAAYTGTLTLDLSKITDGFGNATSGATSLSITDTGAVWTAALS